MQVVLERTMNTLCEEQCFKLDQKSSERLFTVIQTSGTILITSFHVFISRNIFVSPLLSLLKKSNMRVVIVVPEKKVEFFEKEFGGGNVIIHGTKRRLTWKDGLFRDFSSVALRTHSMILRNRIHIEFKKFKKFFFFAPLVRKYIPFVYQLVMPRNTFADIFNQYKPSLVFATDIFNLVDIRLIHEAKAKGIPTVGMVRSWDNLTTKGAVRAIPDIFVVNNEIIKDEAIRYHNIPKEIIRIVGIPHYDRYV